MIHDYLFKLWWPALMAFMVDNGIPYQATNDLTSPHGGTVLVDTEYLNPETISQLKNNGNRIVGFNLVDSSYIAAPCRSCAGDIDLIFSFTGLQTVNTGYELEFDGNFQPKLVERQFLPESDWHVFNMMRLTGRMHSLPYIHWEKQPEPGHMTPKQKNGKVLIRGGAHFRRVTLAFSLLRAGLLDPNSSFALKQFNGRWMNPEFRFCDQCASETERHGVYPYQVGERLQYCNSPASWGKELDLSNTGAWNNRCTRSWYWLADQFEANHGSLDHGQLQALFNGDFVTEEKHQAMLRQASYTADLKWLHSIYCAQRFWDGAICGTVNLLPQRTADQVYFPAIQPFEHYIPFLEGFRQYGSMIAAGNEIYGHIQNNCWSLYTNWIRPTQYKVNTNLLRHIVELI